MFAISCAWFSEEEEDEDDYLLLDDDKSSSTSGFASRTKERIFITADLFFFSEGGCI